MTDVAALISDMVTAGVSPDIIGRVAAALAEREVVPVHLKDETAERKRAYDRRYRQAKRDAEVARHRTTSFDNTTLSPTPPIQEPTPFTPPKGGEFPPPKHDIADLAGELWALQPLAGGKRKATRPDVEVALKAALKRNGKPEDIRAAFRAYYRLPDCTKDGGAYARGAAVLLNADRWREYLPAPKAIPPPATAEQRAKRLRHLRDTGEWFPAWGPKPEPERQTA